MSDVIVIGGSGFVGKRLLKKLIENKYNVKTLIHNTTLDFNVKKFYGDICKINFDHEIHDDDIIINLVGQYNNDISQFINSSIIGSLNILNSCIKKKNVRIILISSISVYGENLNELSKETDEPNPKTQYGLIKLIIEKIHQYYSVNQGLDVMVLRLSTLYGPNKRTGYIAQLIRSIKNKKTTIAYNNGNQKRDILFVDDAIQGIIQGIKNLQKGFIIFNISSSKQYKIKEIIEMIEKISQHKLSIKLSKDSPDEKSLSADNSLAKKILKFNPSTDINSGLKITIEDLLKHN